MTSPLMRRLEKLERASCRDVSLVEILKCMEAARRGDTLPEPDAALVAERTPEDWECLPPLVRCLAQFHIDHIKRRAHA